jgi:hypothetical protein
LLNLEKAVKATDEHRLEEVARGGSTPTQESTRLPPPGGHGLLRTSQPIEVNQGGLWIRMAGAAAADHLEI